MPRARAAGTRRGAKRLYNRRDLFCSSRHRVEDPAPEDPLGRVKASDLAPIIDAQPWVNAISHPARRGAAAEWPNTRRAADASTFMHLSGHARACAVVTADMVGQKRHPRIK